MFTVGPLCERRHRRRRRSLPGDRAHPPAPRRAAAGVCPRPAAHRTPTSSTARRAPASARSHARSRRPCLPTVRSSRGRCSSACSRGAHPDLTWVTPSGASEVLVSDIDEPVVAAAAHTPFESSRRVFVIEAAGSMNDQAANRLLKTLEEPPPFAHLILLAEHREDVLPTIASRCQQVRFDPLSAALLAERLKEGEGASIEPERAAACARLAAGDGQLAELLASERGIALRECAERFVRSALQDSVGQRRWMGLLEAAKAAGAVAGAAVGERLHEQAGFLPSKEQRKYEREGADVVRRAERRERTATLELGLRLAELWLRDVWCLLVGVPRACLCSRPLRRAGGRRRRSRRGVATARRRAGARHTPASGSERLRGAGPGSSRLPAR